MNKLLTFLKQWTLVVALCVGSLVYLLFSEIPVLEPIGDFMGPKLVALLPYVIFLILYVTFCKIQVKELRPRTWHFILQGIRVALSAICVALVAIAPSPGWKLIFEGMFICFICPTAAAAPVITEKLGGSIESMTVYILIANCVTSVIIPLFFPMVEKSADISFLFAFLMVLKRVLIVLIVPLCLALLTRRYLPHVAKWIRDRRNLGSSVRHPTVHLRLPIWFGQARRRALWRQHQCRTSLGTEEYGGGHLAHADISQPLRCHCALRLCGVAKPYQCRTTLGEGEIRSAEVVRNPPRLPKREGESINIFVIFFMPSYRLG